MKSKRLDIADHLKSKDEIKSFLQEVKKTGTEADYKHALNTAKSAYKKLNLNAFDLDDENKEWLNAPPVGKEVILD